MSMSMSPATAYSDTVRKRSALPITDTDERLMASAAMSGLNNQPVEGYRTPAASGIPKALYQATSALGGSMDSAAGEE